jgi:hypothetical protein
LGVLQAAAVALSLMSPASHQGLAERLLIVLDLT